MQKRLESPFLPDFRKREIYIGGLNLSPYYKGHEIGYAGGWILILSLHLPEYVYEELRLLIKFPIKLPVYGLGDEEFKGQSWFHTLANTHFPNFAAQEGYDIFNLIRYPTDYYFLEGAFCDWIPF